MNMKPPRLESVRFFKLHLYPFFFSFKPCRNGAAVLPPKPQKGLALHGSFVYIYSVDPPSRRPLLHDPHVFLHNSHSDSVRDPGGRLPSGAAGPGRPVLQALQAAVRARHGAGGGLSRRSALPHQGFAPVFPKKSRPGHRGGFSFVFVDQNRTRLQISCRGAAQAPCSSTYWIKVSSMVMLWGLPMTWGCMATTIRPFFAFRMP